MHAIMTGKQHSCEPAMVVHSAWSKGLAVSRRLTNSNGCGCQVEEPEEDEISTQLQWEEDNGREDQGIDERDTDLLHHLEYDICAWSVQAIIPLPEQQKGCQEIQNLYLGSQVIVKLPR